MPVPAPDDRDNVIDASQRPPANPMSPRTADGKSKLRHRSLPGPAAPEMDEQRGPRIFFGFVATHRGCLSSLGVMEQMCSATLRRRDADTVEALFRAEYVGMVRLAYTLVGNNDEAEELVQDSFAEVHRRFGEIRKPGAYLRTTVVSRCRSLLRRRRVMQSHPPEAPDDLPGSAGDLWDVLNKLPEDQRLAVVLRYYGRYRASEIAQIMGIPAITVRSHVKRGLTALRKELES
jgi:DNA-directed RNA polymerase specialized sigma24 family protein